MLVARLDDAGARWNGGVRDARSAAKRLVRSAGCADRASVEALEPRLLLALVEWDGGAGTDSWHDALNWSGDEVPTAVDDVVIGEMELEAIRVNGYVPLRSPFRGRKLDSARHDLGDRGHRDSRAGSTRVASRSVLWQCRVLELSNQPDADAAGDW